MSSCVAGKFLNCCFPADFWDPASVNPDFCMDLPCITIAQDCYLRKRREGLAEMRVPWRAVHSCICLQLPSLPSWLLTKTCGVHTLPPLLDVHVHAWAQIHACYTEKYMNLNVNPVGSRSQNNPQVLLWSEQPVHSVNECLFPACIWRALVAGNPLVSCC